MYRRALAFMERTGDDARARQTLLRIALTHHAGSDYPAANAALEAAFARPAPVPCRLDRARRYRGSSWRAGPSTRPCRVGSSSDLGEWVTLNLFRGLVAIGRESEIEPDLAERFSVSDDGCSYRFTLRGDARWSDGVPVTADDFAFTYDRMVEDQMVSAPALAGVTADAVDDRTLEITLAEARNHFLYLLGQPGFFAWPRHVYEQRGRGRLARHPARRERAVRPHRPRRAHRRVAGS